MSNTIYKTVITKLGDSVNEFLSQGMLITFKDNAPAELAEFCVLHSENDLSDEIKVDDTLFINDESFKVTAVGDVVNQNLDSIGHITIRFNGADEADLPGTLCLEEKEIPNLSIGDVIKISR